MNKVIRAKKGVTRRTFLEAGLVSASLGVLFPKISRAQQAKLAIKPMMTAYFHRVEFMVGSQVYIATTSSKKGEDNFTLEAKGAAICSISQTVNSFTMTGSDAGRKFTLTLVTDGNETNATMQIGNNRLTTKASPNQIWAKLKDQLSKDTRMRDRLPTGTALEPIAKEMHNPKFVGVLIGQPEPVSISRRRKSYCEAVCDGCADGGLFSPWYCISCASCDYFDVDFSGRFGALFL